jgi:hypothetical protein
MKSHFPVFIVGFCLSVAQTFAQSPDFHYRIINVLDANAQKHVVEMHNFKVFKEQFSKGNSYWGVIANDQPARLTMKFDTKKPIKSGKLFSNIIVCNFENAIKQGNGKSECSVWCSRNGKEWILVKSCPTPSTGIVDKVPLGMEFPKEIQGSYQFWIQFRMTTHNTNDPSYSVAQVGRNDEKDSNASVFELRIHCQD